MKDVLLKFENNYSIKYIEFEMVMRQRVNETMGSFEEIVFKTESQAGKEWWGHFSFKKYVTGNQYHLLKRLTFSIQEVLIHKYTELSTWTEL